jgi:hypothetical protein
MNWREMTNEPVIELTGCVRCDGLRKASKNRVRYCLRHDPSLTEEWRQLNRIALEPLPKKEGV